MDNLYRACENDCVNRVDALGMMSLLPWLLPSLPPSSPAFNVEWRQWNQPVTVLPGRHYWLHTDAGSYGWYPSIDWDVQTAWQKFSGVSGITKSADPADSLTTNALGYAMLTINTGKKLLGSLQYGTGKGKWCLCLKQSNPTHKAWVEDCIDKAAAAESGTWQVFWNNCSDAAKRWLNDCCLYKP